MSGGRLRPQNADLMREAPAPLVVSFLLDCDAGIGHSIDYNLSIQRASRMNGWTHRAALTTLWAQNLPDLPSDWEICLSSPNFTRLHGQPTHQVAGLHQ